MVPTVVDPIGQKCKIAKIQDGGGRHLGFQKNVNNFRKDEAILTKFHQHIPGTNCHANEDAKLPKSKYGDGRHLGFQKMSIISASIERFEPNFTNLYMVPTVIDPIGHKCKIFKIQDGGVRHLRFTKM